MATRIVVDTNVFVSALISASGDSRRALRLCLQGKYQPLMGNTLFTEYESLLNRADIMDKSPLNQQEIQALLAAFIRICEWISVYYLWRPNLKDEGDNHLIELAIAGDAAIIVTNNTKDFQGAELIFPHLSILRPMELL
ncbi:putative toxin-antitoxin system toxin component, PIN family (plasmid) [Picosynechococcus sp. PCC 11901]|uniref:putative toxin-antitoxin system toxin component, PIN family n=1 Tax=unclassified Picosynechococcus TaxID=3079910 RepID=UPI0004A9FA85|nr:MULTISPECIES: putative toxin-antitoxin system toxin component, PIN family [unclassified Picosynechococcus]QCS48072.1 putative toxin-antitoxin system toxin component, PIN family [Picosynechococcus sp. PCC 11901]